MESIIHDLIEPTDSPAVLQTATALLPILYEDLIRVARRERRLGRACDTFHTTALVHEAYIKLRNVPAFNDKSHFLRASALAMRHILINSARARMTSKREGRQVGLETVASELQTNHDVFLVELNEALRKLAVLNLRLARVIECRFYAGFDDGETARALCVTERTVRRDWLKARAWLLRELGWQDLGRLPGNKQRGAVAARQNSSG